MATVDGRARKGLTGVAPEEPGARAIVAAAATVEAVAVATAFEAVMAVANAADGVFRMVTLGVGRGFARTVDVVTIVLVAVGRVLFDNDPRPSRRSVGDMRPVL